MIQKAFARRFGPTGKSTVAAGSSPGHRILVCLVLALAIAAAGVFALASASTARAALAAEALPGQTETHAETITVAVSGVVTVRFAQPAAHVAAYWQGGASARVTLAFSSDGVDFSEPVDAGRDDAGGALRNGMTYGAVLAADGAIAVRVTTDTPLAGLSLIAISPGESPVARSSGSATRLAAEADQPTVISRTGWGANLAYLNWAPRFYPAKKVIVHHTADGAVTGGTQESYAKLVRSIYYYHAVTRDWGDIAYNFLIDPLGNIYEGRYSDSDTNTPSGEDAYGNGVVGGHTYNYNTGTVGVAVLGTYSSKDISAAARASLERLLAWVVKRHGIDPVGFGPYYSPFSTGSTVQTWNIAGHRDYGSTDCPGQAFYNTLPAIRQVVFALTGAVSTPTPSPSYVTVSISPSSPVVGQQVTVSATLTEESSRAPLSGRTVSFATGGIATAQTSLGAALTDSTGVATVQMTFTAAGMRWVSADFGPGADGAYRGSTTSVGVNVAPTGVSAIPGNTSVQLSWSAAPEASGYNLYRNGVKVNSAPVKSTVYVDSGLTNGASYSYQLTVIVGGRESAKSPAVGATPVATNFLDVAAHHPYRLAIQSLAGAGVISGTTDGKFHPDDPVTRQQFAKMIVLGCEFAVAESDVCRFKDVTKSGPSSLYPDNHVAACVARGITVGKTATTFDPYTNITRAQVATMVVRAAEAYKPSAIQRPPAGWRGVLPASDPTHGANIAVAEYNGLLAGIDLFAFSITGKATRGQIAQIIWNLREK